MFKSYLKVAWRNIKRNKVSSFINILGLTVGLTSCLLIALFMYHENSYDRYHKNGERVFQLGTNFMDEGKDSRRATTAAPIGAMMQQDFPEVQATARLLSLFRDDKTLLRPAEASTNATAFYETGGYLADPSLFNILTFDFKEGSATNALAQPNTVVLSEEVAHKLFGKTSALDKMVRIASTTNGDHDFRVTGVYRMPPGPSHLNARFIMSFAGGDMNAFANNDPSPVFNNMFFTYVLLQPGANADKLQARFPSFVKTHLAEFLKETGRDREFFLQPVKDIHLSEVEGNLTPAASKKTLFILASIALLTLLIACINFMNLATAGSAKRAAEVGVRKVLGAERQSLVRQFFGESLLMAFLSFVLALLLSYLLMPLFVQVTGIELRFEIGESWLLLLGFFVLAVVTGLLAGSYPAFYLSSFRPIKVLKGKFSNSLAAASLRRGLVVFQFVISIGLIVASLVIAAQMNFLRDQPLGFSSDQQLVIPLRSTAAKQMAPALKKTIASQPSVYAAGMANAYPGIFHPQDWVLYKEGDATADNKQVFINSVDADFTQTLGVQTIAGRVFSPQFTADSNTSFVINEEAVKQFGFPSAQAAVGKWLAMDVEGEQYRFNIVGVVKSFHFNDLHQSIQPYAFRLSGDDGFGYLLVHLKAGDLQQSLSRVTAAWKNLNPNEPFEFSFLDQDFQKNYEAENRQSALIRYFTIVAIIISCLGLFGLATFTAEQRTKELGIRKVLGANVRSLVTLLSLDFVKLVAIAVVIALPLAWYGMNQWLQNFAYRINIGWAVFALSTVIALFIALATVSFQAVKAALSNPVKNLRTE